MSRPGRALHRRSFATALLGLDIAASGTVIAVLAATPASRVGDTGERLSVLAFVVGTLGLAVVGRLVVIRRPAEQRIGWLLLAVGVLGGCGRALIGLALVQPEATPAALAWSTNWVWVPGAAAVLLLLLRFPTGSLPSRHWRWVEMTVVAWSAVVIGVTAVVPGPLAVTPLGRENPLGVEGAPWLVTGLTPLFAALPLLTVVAAGALLVRYRRATTEERQQLAWMAAAVTVLALTATVAAAGDLGALLESAAYLLLPLALGVAVLKHRLYDLGLVVRRALAYALASALLLALYVVTVAAMQSLLRGRAPDLIATAAVAVAAVPALSLARGVIERLLFGDRRDPDRVVRQLSERLASTPEALLPQVVTQVAHSLRLPYVAVELPDGSVPASSGHRVPAAVRVPLTHRGTAVGWLLAGPRAPDEGLGAHDLLLLQRVAAQAGMAVQSTQLTAELEQASARLRAARSEERARLQRDLHDGLGPALGAIAMRTEAARNLLRRGAALDQVDDVLDGVERGAASAVAEVRRVVAELQPQVLEEHGLHAALREAADAVPPGLVVRLDLAATPAVPPRVELVAYRIAAEALRNVVRHSRAAAAALSVRVVGAALELTVSDDGVGLPDEPRRGVGMGSMRARATSLGGSLHVSAGEHGGTVVRALLPLEQP